MEGGFVERGNLGRETLAQGRESPDGEREVVRRGLAAVLDEGILRILGC